MTTPILEFKGKYAFLSNFAHAEFMWDGIYWWNSEAAYQAAKVLDREARLRISMLINPVHAKKLGKRVAMRSDWEAVKYDTMHEIVLAKFTQNPHLKEELLATGDAHLEEGNTWNDRIWGVCPPGSGDGKNWLGLILMSVRETLK